MKVTEQWLREWADAPVTSAELAEQLTLAGLEVESVVPVATADGRDDYVLDVAVTPNRGDCLSIAGIAREVAVLNRLKLTEPAQDDAPVTGRGGRGVTLKAPRACPRYAGRVIEGIDPRGVTPAWIAERLQRCGLRPVSAVVDITNYVMLELGQPLHAFDQARLRGGIDVRMAEEGEKIMLLDGEEYELAGDTLVIADQAGAVALAGIMGGADSAVSAESGAVFLESAYFAPDAIRGRARRHGLMTDASYRFERGVDFTLQRRALERATKLILECCGGTAGPVVDVQAPQWLPGDRTISLRRDRLRRVLGISLEPDVVRAILERLGMAVKQGPDAWQVSVPPYRFDLALEADLIEEVARIHGYAQVPGTRVRGSLAMQHKGSDERFGIWRRVLAERGYYEAITYSFVNQAVQEQLLGPLRAVTVINAISPEMGVMRASLWPGLLQALQFNLRRQQERVRLFEIGRVFRLHPDLNQNFNIAGVIYGSRYEKQWDINDISCDFYDLKNDVEALLRAVRPDLEIGYLPLSHPGLHPARSAEIHINGQAVGRLGAINPGLSGALELPGEIYLFELEIQQLPDVGVRSFKKISKFPSVHRDVAVLVDAAVPAGQVLECVRAAGGELLVNLQLFDVYAGESIDLGKKSLALGLTFQETSSTLIEEEVDSALGGILERLREDLGAKLRE